MMHVSITGLRLRSSLYFPLFAWHALRSMAQARAADGNLMAAARTVTGLHHTLSAWRSREDMLVYLASGSHLRAMKAFDSIATGRTYGYAAEFVPDWEEALDIWRSHGRVVGRAANPRSDAAWLFPGEGS